MTIFEVLSGVLILLEMYNMSFLNSMVGVLESEFQISLLQISYLHLTFSIGASASIPLTKFVSRKFSLHFSMYLLITLSSAAALISFYSHNWQMFCLARGLQGFTLTLLYCLTFIKALEQSKNTLKTLNNINGLSIVGMILGPLVSGYLYLSNWRISYLLTVGTLSILLCIIYWKMPRTIKLPRATKKFPIVEYLLLIMVLSCITYLSIISKLDIFAILVIASVAISVGVIIYSYLKTSTPKLFNKEIFNFNLLMACSLNILSRCALVGIPPLYSYVLYKYYSCTITQISLFLMVSAVFSLLAKISFYRINLLSKCSGYAFIGFALSLIANSWLMSYTVQKDIYFVIFALYGFFSSLVFNFVNLSFYAKQSEQFTDDLTVITTLFQMFVYGICINITLFLWHNLTDYSLSVYQMLTSVNLVLIIFIIISYILFRKVTNYEH